MDMKKIMSLMLILLLIFCINPATFGQAIPKRAFILNSVANTLSVFDIENQSMILDTLSPGANSFPNHMVMRNGKGYVLNSGINDIMVFDLATLQRIRRIPLPNGTNPWAMDFINDTLCVVSFWLTDQVALVNVNSNQILNTIRVGTSPEGIKYHQGKIYVANSGYVNYTMPYKQGSIGIIDEQSFTLLDSIMVATNPQDLDLDSHGRLLVACTGDYTTSSGQLDIIDTSIDSVISSLNLSSFITSVRVSPQDKAYVATYGSGVMVYDLVSHTLEVNENSPLLGGPGVAFDSHNNAYIVEFGDGVSAGILRIFSSSHQQLNSYTVNVGPVFVAVYDPVLTPIEDISVQVLNKAKLDQNYPNPFNPVTSISFQISSAGMVSLDIFNLIGQKVASLFQGTLPGGDHQFEWNGKDDFGIQLPSGIYIYRLKTREYSLTRKMFLIR